MEIYILINDQPHGPYTPELIRQYLKAGELQPEQLAAQAGTADWKPLSEMVQSWQDDSGTSIPPVRSNQQQTRGRDARQDVRVAKSRGKTVFMVSGVVLLLLAGGVGGAYWKWFGDSGPVVKVVTPADPGFPNTLAELNAWYAQPPDGQNAAMFFEKGFEAMQITDADRNSRDLPVIGKGVLPALGAPLPPKTKAALARLMVRNKTALEAFRQGAKCESSRYPLNLNTGYDTVLPDLPKIKTVEQLEGLAAVLYAENRAPDAAAETVEASLGAAQSLKSEPILFSQMMRLACLSLARANLERVVNSVALRPMDLDRLAAVVDKAEADESTGNPFTRALAGERASALAFFDLPPDKQEDTAKKMAGVRGDAGAAQAFALKKLMRNLKSQRAFAEETFNRAILMRKQAFPERLKVDEFFATRVAEAKSNEFLLCTLMLPALGRQAGKEAGGLAELRLMQTAVALERYRAANNNRYPIALRELSPKILLNTPCDPFTGDALGYKKTATGYELSSTGPEPGKGSSFTVVKPPPAIAASAGSVSESDYLKNFKEQTVLPTEAVSFITGKESLVAEIAKKNGVGLPPELENFFAAAKAGRAGEARKLYRGFHAVGGIFRDASSPIFKTGISQAVLDAYLVVEAFASCEADLVKTLENDLMGGLPAGCIFFGGTDMGRGLPAMACHVPGDPVFVLTQNQIANGRYLDYARELYGSGIWLPTTNDVQQCLESYLADAQDRAKQNKLEPGENLRMENGMPKIQGYVGEMKVAGMVAKLIFDKNPDREFYIEQSFPMDWANPYLSPSGLVFRINRQALAMISAKDVQNDMNFWKVRMAQLKSNPAFAGDYYARTSYAHDCAAIASLYAWRTQNANDADDRGRMFEAATNTFELSLSMVPSLPEAVNSYASLLMSFGKTNAALSVAQKASQADPANTQLTGLVWALERMVNQNTAGQQ